MASFVIAVTVFETRISRIQESRKLSAEDTCHLMTRLVLTAAAENKAPNSSLEAQIFLQNTGLANCNSYAARATDAR